MVIAGLQKLTLLDFPGRLACTVFLSGCNLRCPFCHNASLVLQRNGAPPPMETEALLDFLGKRRGRLQGVCISGGEPTLHPDLPDLIRSIRALGYGIKLDTNGTNPSMLRRLLDEGLVDYVAMDIKNSPTRYRQTCGGADVLQQVRESAALLMAGTTDYEFRTTLCHPLHTPEDMRAIGAWLQGARRYFLQGFIDSGDLLDSSMRPLSDSEMAQCLAAVTPHIKETTIRGI